MKTTTFLSRSALALAFVFGAAVPMACDGEAEEAGETVDEAVDDAADAIDG